MTNPFLKSVSLETRDGKLIIQVEAIDLPSRTSKLRVRFFVIDDIATIDHWIEGIECVKSGDNWIGGADTGHPPKIESVKYTIVKVGILDEEGNQLSKDKDLFFVPPDGDGIWAKGDEAEKVWVKIQETRNQRFNKILSSAVANKDQLQEFKVTLLIENILLSDVAQVPAVQVFPLEGADLNQGARALLSEELSNQGLEIDASLGQEMSVWPAAFMYIYVEATTSKEARTIARYCASDFLDLVAFRRSGAPRLLGGVVCACVNGRVISHVDSWNEIVPYDGNWAAGPISGEDPHALYFSWSALQRSPQIRLWLSLYADALAEERWDYKVFRFFNLLEGIALTLYGNERHVVTDHAGKVIEYKDNYGKTCSYTTKEGKGKVYYLIKEHLITSGESYKLNQELWKQVGLWYFIRNKVAHEGSWDNAYTQKLSGKRQKEFDKRLRQITNIRSAGSFELGVVFVGLDIREAVSDVISAELGGLT